MQRINDVATRADVRDLADFLKFEYALVKRAVDVGTADANRLPIPPRREHDIRALYELIQTGQRNYFE
jgi:hypothetical protein